MVPSLGPDEGQGTLNLKLLEAVARAGHQVDVFTSKAPDSVEALPGVRLRRIPRLPTWQLGNQLFMLLRTTTMVRPSRYDLVHADAGVTMRRADVLVCPTLSDRWYDLPADVWRERGVRGRHAALATRFKAWLEVRHYRRGAAVLAIATDTAKDLAARGVDAERVTVLPMGVDAGRFRPPTATERAAARVSFGIPPDAFVVGFVGAHGPRKGLPAALDALALAQPGEHLLAVGAHRGGQWVRVAEERRLPVTMPGRVEDVRDAYWASDVFAHPSRYDAFGMSVLEAMACGLPVVVSRDAGSHEIVRDAGFVLTEVSSYAVRAAIDALRADPGRRVAMGMRAREIAREHTWDKAGATLLDVYARVAKGAENRETSAV